MKLLKNKDVTVVCNVCGQKLVNRGKCHKKHKDACGRKTITVVFVRDYSYKIISEEELNKTFINTLEDYEPKWDLVDDLNMSVEYKLLNGYQR